MGVTGKIGRKQVKARQGKGKWKGKGKKTRCLDCYTRQDRARQDQSAYAIRGKTQQTNKAKSPRKENRCNTNNKKKEKEKKTPTAFVGEYELRQCQRRVHPYWELWIVKCSCNVSKVCIQVLLTPQFVSAYYKRKIKNDTYFFIRPIYPDLTIVPTTSHACIHESSETQRKTEKTDDGSQIRLLALKLWRHKLHHERFHVPLDVGMAHQPRAKSRDHVESAESLRGR